MEEVSAVINNETNEVHVNKTDSKIDKPFKCDYCDKRYALKKSLVFHAKSKHFDLLPAKVEKCYKCQYCPKSYLHKRNLIHHQRVKHKSELDSKINSKEFDSVADFINWKYEFEDMTLSRFICQSGKTNCQTYIGKSYVCFRKGLYKPLNLYNRKRLNKKGSYKVGDVCKAKMYAKFYKSGKVTVILCSKHTGHDPQDDRKFLFFRERELNHIRSLFAEGLTKEEVYERLKSAPNFEHLSRKRIYNITRRLKNPKRLDYDPELKGLVNETSNPYEFISKLDSVKNNRTAVKLKASFLKSLEHQGPDMTLSQPTPLKDLIASSHGVCVIKVICEFLQFMGFDEVLEMLQAKVPIAQNVNIDRKELAKEFNIQEDSTYNKYPFIWSLLANRNSTASFDDFVNMSDTVNGNCTAKEKTPTKKKAKKPIIKKNKNDHIIVKRVPNDPKNIIPSAVKTSTHHLSNDSQYDCNSSYQVRLVNDNIRREIPERCENVVTRGDHATKLQAYILSPNSSFVVEHTSKQMESCSTPGSFSLSLLDNHNGAVYCAKDSMMGYVPASSPSSSSSSMLTCANQNVRKEAKKVYIIKSSTLNNTLSYAPSMLASEADITIPQFSTIPSSATHNIQTHLISPELLEAVESITLPQSFVEVETAHSPPRKNPLNVSSNNITIKRRSAQCRKSTFK